MLRTVYAFMSWLAILDRLSTMDRVVKWSQGVDVTCVLCKNAVDNRNHLFFECSYSSQIWDHLMRGVLGSSYTTDWQEVVGLLSRTDRERRRVFCTRYAFQASIHTIWRERNRIKHGEKPLPLGAVMKLLDKGIRNKLSLMRYKGGKGLEDILQYWFNTRV